MSARNLARLPRPSAAGRLRTDRWRLSAALQIATAIMVLASAGPALAKPFRLIEPDLTTAPLPNSIMDLAVSLGYFQREGVDVQLVRVQQTPTAVAALQAGEGEMANLALDTILQLTARHQMDLKVVMSPDKSLPYMIAAKDGVADLAALSGKAFGVGRVGSLDYSLTSKVLAARGVDPKGVRFVNIGAPGARLQALAAGQIDATTVSLGTWLSLPDKKGLHELMSPEDYFEAAPVMNKANVVTAEVLKERRPDVEAVTRALIKISRDFAADPTRWVDAMVKARPDIKRSDLEQLAAGFKDNWSINGGLDRAALAFAADWNYATPDFKALPPVSLADWVDFSVTDAILVKEGILPGADPASR